MLSTFQHILTLHRATFPPANPPVAPPPTQPDRSQLYAYYERQALQGIGRFKRAEREQARQRAMAWTEAEAQRQWNEQVQLHHQAQTYLDQMWHQLCANTPDVVLDTLQEAFEDNEAPSAVLSVDGDQVSIALLVPGLIEVVPERWPTTTQAGNLSFKKLPKRDRSDYYTLFVCAQVLVTIREAFAVAPGIQTVRVAALRIDGHSIYGDPQVVCLVAAAVDRIALGGVRWESASAADILNQAAREKLLKQSGPAKELTAIDLSSEPELQALVRSIDLRDLGQTSANANPHEPAAPQPAPINHAPLRTPDTANRYGSGVAHGDHRTAYRFLNDELLSALSKVDSSPSAQDFAHQSADLVRKEARHVPEFHVAEFISIFKDSTVAHVGAESERAQQAIHDAQIEAQVATVELSARLEAARAAGDRVAEHALWGERDDRQKAVQARIDAAGNSAKVLGLRLQAFEQLASALDVKLN